MPIPMAPSMALGPASDTVDGYLEFALDHLIDFFFRMEVLVNRRSPRKVVMRECHVLRVEISPRQPGKRSTTGRRFVSRKGMGRLSNALIHTLANQVRVRGRYLPLKIGRAHV